jgi:hypothetical protein
MKTVLRGRGGPLAPAVVLTFIFLLGQCRGERTITITFEGPPTQPPRSAYLITNYYELAMSFVQMGRYGRRHSAGSPGWPDNGTTYIQPEPRPVACTRLDGLSFRLISVDLAGYSAVVPDYPASFEGHRSDGSVETTNFQVSGITFQRYYFGPEFGDLTNVLVTAGALDNLVTRVPSVPPVLKIGTYSYHSDSWMTLEARGTSGFLYRLDYSENLAGTNWTTLTNFEAYYFRNDYVTTNFPAQRFFRVVELP